MSPIPDRFVAERLGVAGDALFHGRFRLRAEIGRGGAGTVWEAEDARDGDVVAVKLLPADAGGLAAAEREAEVAVRVRHPNAVRVLLTFEEHGRAAVVMERCVGSAAEHVLVHGPLAPERAAQLMRGVLEALDAAHAVGVIHRDVKPANVLLRADGSVALGDWGIARALFGSGATHTTSVALLGTLPYMAPELRQDPRAASPASDVYAAGVTLAWLCTGAVPHDPFVAAGEAALRAALPVGIAEVVVRACAWEPKERFAHAREMAAALGRAVEESAGDGPPSPTRRAARGAGGVAGGGPPAPRGALRASAVAPILGAVAALVAAGASVWGALRSENEPLSPSASALAETSSATDPHDLPACPGAPSSFVERRERGPVESIGATAGHLDDDGRLDVVFSNQGAETLTVWWSSADGLPREHEEIVAGRVSGAVAVLDTDGDGRDDLVVPHKDDGAFTVRRGLGSRAFGAPRTVLQGPAPAAVFPAGRGALVFATGGAVFVRRVTASDPWPPGVPLGGPAPLHTHTAAFVEGGSAWVAAGDGEGRLELLVASDDPGAIRRRPLPAIARDGDVLPWIGADGVATALAALRDEVLLRVAPGEPCRVGAWRGGVPQLLADLDADGVVDVVGTSTCTGCTSNHVFLRGL